MTYDPPTIDPTLEGPFDGDPCPHCDDTGEVWHDVEVDGRVREDMHVCGCGS